MPEGDEECDDGNDFSTDDCNDCFLTYCGDGIVKTSGVNVEECDGGFGDAIPITGPCTD